MSAGKIVLLIFGIIFLIVAIGLIFSGGAFIWLYHAPTDSEGFVSCGTLNIERNSNAIVTSPIEIDENVLSVLNWIGLGAVRVQGASNDPSKQIFIGVARERDIETYLRDVDYDEMTRITSRLFIVRADYSNHPGNSDPADPVSKAFWTVSRQGAGTQTLEWAPEVGSHELVLMNTDGSAGIDMNVALKVKVPVLIFALGVTLVMGGVVALITGSIMVFYAVRRS